MVHVHHCCHWIIAAAVVLGGVFVSECRGQGAATVVVSEVLARQVVPKQAFVANVRPNRQVVIGSAVDGRVLHYPVVEGQAVSAREGLAELRTATIEIELAGARAELDLRRAELKELKNGSRPEEIQLAEAQLQAAIAAQEYARARFRRIESLFTRASGVSQDEFEEARAQALQATAARVEAENALELVRQGPRSEQIEQAAARVAVQEQVVAGLEDRLAKYTIRSPFDGFVIAELTEAGAWVQQGDPVAEVAEIDPAEVVVFVPDTMIQFMRPGLKCPVRVAALGNQTFEGEVVQIVPLADESARTFPVKVRVEHAPEDGQYRLLPGMLAEVILPSGPERRSLLVPKDALKLGGPQPVVIKVAGGKAVPVTVTTGSSDGAAIAVTPAESGMLAEGDTIVVRGNERLRGGEELEVSKRLDTEGFLEAEGSPGRG